MEKKKVESQGIWVCVGGFIRMVCSGLFLSNQFIPPKQDLVLAPKTSSPKT